MKIGARLRALRKERKMALVELSRQSGVAIATLSRIEHDKMTGTVNSHAAISKALGMTLSDFYGEIETGQKDVSVLKSGEKLVPQIYQKKYSAEVLAQAATGKKMLPLLIRLKQGSLTQQEKGRPGQEKFIYVLEGNVKADLGKDSYALSKGDCLYFDASLANSLANETDREALVLTVTTQGSV